MNRNTTAFLTLLVASAATLAAWRLGWYGPAYARVLSATPVAVREPRYADVVKAVPVPSPNGPPAVWDVTYRQGARLLHTHTRSDPGDQVRVGEQRRVIGYDVVWRWRDRTGVARLGRRPGKHLPVEQGAVVARRGPALSS
jgi:uncharacterized protein YcfJ